MPDPSRRPSRPVPAALSGAASRAGWTALSTLSGAVWRAGRTTPAALSGAASRAGRTALSALAATGLGALGAPARPALAGLALPADQPLFPGPPAPVPAPAQTLHATSGLAGVALEMALALLAILAVIFLAYYLLKKFGPRLGLPMSPGQTGNLRIVGRLALGPRKHLVVVRFLNTHLVLGVTEQRINLLTKAVIDHEAAPDFTESMSKAAEDGET